MSRPAHAASNEQAYKYKATDGKMDEDRNYVGGDGKQIGKTMSK